MSAPLRILVISDIHSHYVDRAAQAQTYSHAYSNRFRAPVNNNPFESLLRMVRSNGLHFDHIVCPGDLCDQANDQGLLTAFSYLREIRACVPNAQLHCTLGNHDVAYKAKHLHNSETQIRGIGIDFPVDVDSSSVDKTARERYDSLRNDFFAKSYYLHVQPEFALLNFNSSYNLMKSASNEKPIIEDHVLESMRNDLGAATMPARRICVLHHHPLQHSEVEYEDVDELANGDRLLALLREFSFGLVIHGHKHSPVVRTYRGLPIFCAGSFGSTRFGNGHTFHIVSVDPDSRGKIETHFFSVGTGWQHPRLDQSISSTIGFGFHGDVQDLAERCIAFTNGTGSRPKYDMSELLGEVPDLEFLNTDERMALQDFIRQNSGYDFSPPMPNLPKYFVARSI